MAHNDTAREFTRIAFIMRAMVSVEARGSIPERGPEVRRYQEPRRGGGGILVLSFFGFLTSFL